MADLKKLQQFELEETEEGYAIRITTESGEALAVEVSPEQLDAIIDALDDLLNDDDAFEEEGEAAD
jgi:hypothetical protein